MRPDWEAENDDYDEEQKKTPPHKLRNYSNYGYRFEFILKMEQSDMVSWPQAIDSSGNSCCCPWSGNGRALASLFLAQL